ncbi:hypothetical protein KQI84_04245 [bacterium]|nr:hypothetical protein [bacterium]
MTTNDSSPASRPGLLQNWQWRTALLIGLAALVACAIVHHPKTGWNVNTRLNLVFAIVDQQTFAIDDYHELEPYATGDKAFYEGHYYCDKIIGLSLLAVPPYAALRMVGWSPTFQQANYALRLLAVSIPGAIVAALMWLLMVRLGAAPRRALFAVAAAFFGTMLFGYSTVFYPYLPGIASAMAALWMILFPRARRLTVRNSFAIGLLCGFAMLCDLTFGLLIVGIGVVFLIRLLDQAALFGVRAFADMRGMSSPKNTALKILAAGIIGGILPLAVFVLYSISIFGSPTIPYAYEVSDRFREGMQAGLMGVTTPRLAPLWFITLHPFRGLFFWSPILLLAAGGSIMQTRSSGRRRIIGWLGLWCLVSYLLFNAGYYMWWSGWSMGSRLLLPMLAVTPLGLAEWCRRDRAKGLWWTILVIGTISILLSAPLSLIDPQIPQGNDDEVLAETTFATDLEIPQFVYLQVFYNGEILKHPEVWIARGNRGLFLGGLLIVIGLFAAAVFWTPPKHLPFERLELPSKSLDGSAGPAPQPIR